MSIQNNIKKIVDELPQHVKLVAVSKTKPVADIFEAYELGQKIFGENKAQEMIDKQLLLPENIQWHFIGHLQTNKVKHIAQFVSMIEAVDSLKLFKEINKQALKNNRIIKCLMQFHIAGEETKFGLDITEAEEILNNEEFQSLKNIQINGVMGMATFTENMSQIRSEFKQLKKIFDFLKKTYFQDSEYFRELSMGMSGDYKIAIEEGSTIVRIGSLIFGERN